MNAEWRGYVWPSEDPASFSSRETLRKFAAICMNLPSHMERSDLELFISHEELEKARFKRMQVHQIVKKLELALLLLLGLPFIVAHGTWLGRHLYGRRLRNVQGSSLMPAGTNADIPD